MEDDKHEERAYVEALKILTPREIEVLELIGKGYTCKHVAERLNLSVYTVQTHVKVIKRKLSVSGYRGLVVWYRENWEG